MFTLNCKGRLLPIEDPVVMGILNVTPDSFYGGSRVQSENALITKAGKMLEDGAAILDIGGQSSRPGAAFLDQDEELKRVIPAIKLLRKNFANSFISVDTFHAGVAIQAIESGADMVNDISAGNIDPTMIETVGKLKVPYIAMHMRGTPATMNTLHAYNNLITDILDYFKNKIQDCRNAGITDIMIDPGFGFSKNINQNFELLQSLEAFHILECPILVGLSRKSLIYKTLEISPEDALNGTTVLNTIALQKGAMILRVHDVREAVECIKLTKAINKKMGL